MNPLPEGDRTQSPPGAYIPPDEKTRARRWRNRLLLFMGGTVALLVAGNLLYATASFTRNDRSYCLSCHSVDRPAGLWEPSEMHAEGMACFSCHGVLPGREALCGAFSAHPDTVNPNCIGCHPGILEGRPLGRTVEAWRAADLSGEEELVARWDLRDMMYTWHVRNRVCVCTDCHRNVAHDSLPASPARNRPRMEYCAECHYHSAKDDYVRVHPIPELRTVPAGEGGGGPGP